jgi:integrase
MTSTYGAGTMTEITPGRWRLRVYVGRDPSTGRPIQRSKNIRTPSRSGKRVAQLALKAFAADVEAEDTLTSWVTFGHLLTEWMANLPRRGRRASTVETYNWYIEKRIRPYLGGVRLDQLTARHLDDLYVLLQEEGLAPGTIKQVHAICSGALTQGVKWGWITSNPAQAASPPADTKVREQPPTPTEVRKLIDAAMADEDYDVAACLALGASTGARRGELLGLQWADLDLDEGTARIERQWVPGKGGQTLGPTKTGEKRTIVLGKYEREVLGWYQEIMRERLPGWEPDPRGWVLSMNGGETPLRAKSVTEYVTRLSKRTGLTVHFHSLRHFAATYMAQGGVHARTAADRLGHTSTMTTLDHYTSSTNPADREAAEVLGRALRNT